MLFRSIFVWSITLVLAFTPGLTATADESALVSVEDMKNVWTNTRICQVKCNLQIIRKDYIGEVDTPFSSSATGVKVPKRRDEDGFFARDCNSGMRLQVGDRESNLFDGKAVSYWPEPPGLNGEGLNSVIFQEKGDSNIQADAITISLLHWLDPLATQYYAKIISMELDSLAMSQDPDFGDIVRISQEDRQRTTFTFSKKFDWRIVEVATDFDGKPVRRRTYRYSRSNNQLKCDGITTNEFNPRTNTLEETSEVEVSNVDFSCMDNDIRLEIPSYSLVYDGTVKPPKEYLIRRDGSIREFSPQERKLASSWSDLLESEEGELFSKIPFDPSKWYLFFAGLGVLGVGIYLYFRSNSNRV